MQRNLTVYGGGKMKIGVYSKDIGMELTKLIMDYCQRWNCYPAIETYSEKKDLIDGMKIHDLDIAILNCSRHDGDNIAKESEKAGIRTKFIWISTDNFNEAFRPMKGQKKQQFLQLLAQKIEKELELYGIPSKKQSLCRVHLRA